MLRFIAILSAVFWAVFTSAASAAKMRLAVTTSFHNSGLSDTLLPLIRRDTGIDVRLIVVGTGQALRLGRAGDVDAILVHSKKAEEQFVAEGFAPYRREIMFNDFVLVGPRDDPAKISQADSATDALRRIASRMASFLSRGDDSGTHRKELTLWANIDRADWYREGGSGMGATLNTAAAMNAYTLADRASWLNFANRGDLALLYSGDPALFNQYAYLPVSKERHPHVEADAAKAVEGWLTSETGQTAIGDYRLGSEQLFTPNAE